MTKPPARKDPAPLASESAPERDEFEREVRARVTKSIGPVVKGGEREQVISRVTSLLMNETFSGPIPHPRQIAEYEAACPGAADRLIAMAEKNNDANIEALNTSISHERDDRRLGMVLGFLSLMGIIAGAVFLAAIDKPAIAGGLLGIGVIGTISVFVNGRREK